MSVQGVSIRVSLYQRALIIAEETIGLNSTRDSLTFLNWRRIVVSNFRDLNEFRLPDA